MADETKFTQADLDAAIAKATGKFQESVDRLETKNEELVGEVRKYKAEARKAGEIKPEDLQAAEDRAEKAEAALAEANKQVKALTGERDKAVKDKETVETAARDAFRSRDISTAIAGGGIVPDLADAYTALIEKGAVTELVDGKYVTKFGDKPIADYVKEHLASDAGKHFKAAAANGGGGAPGGGSGGKGDVNPFAKETVNLTEQTRLYREDPTRAKELASAAGVKLPA